MKHNLKVIRRLQSRIKRLERERAELRKLLAAALVTLRVVDGPRNRVYPPRPLRGRARAKLKHNPS